MTIEFKNLEQVQFSSVPSAILTHTTETKTVKDYLEFSNKKAQYNVLKNELRALKKESFFNFYIDIAIETYKEIRFFVNTNRKKFSENGKKLNIKSFVTDALIVKLDKHEQENNGPFPELEMNLRGRRKGFQKEIPIVPLNNPKKLMASVPLFLVKRILGFLKSQTRLKNYSDFGNEAIEEYFEYFKPKE